MDKNKKVGFTLAEVLITLVIIGVIAALTIPNLMQKYQEQTTVKKVQKFYSTLSNAYALSQKENGPMDSWGITGRDEESAAIIYEMLFKPFFKISKDCGVDNTGKCFTNSVKWLNNVTSTFNANDQTNYKVTLDDGSAVAMQGSVSGKLVYTVITYDVNGIKGPNQWGKDFFIIGIRSDKQTPYPYGFPEGGKIVSAREFNTFCQKDSTESYAGLGCAAWVIYKGNMDYLHCDGLTWNSRSCKDK